MKDFKGIGICGQIDFQKRYVGHLPTNSAWETSTKILT